MALADEMIGQYRLNADQSEALKQCARMFKLESSPTRITLIHGMTIYGSGCVTSQVVMKYMGCQ